ncbi:hypothetical protein RKE29_17435 [Streptomyces sp. B1866]|uniref:hypothetical protein n=1 Tax=Streptomyces sp. B1866 TaxID=3075431 RepID=UPI0028915F45|nr:hypothetical protein [Streptomyces sp. B1866]MDT3398409.1 hypothetical protein [Streptomyces sp. B1866]
MRALPLRPRFAWLEITGLCNLTCRHCYANSSPKGDHGTMTDTDWFRVIDELDALGVRDVPEGGAARRAAVPPLMSPRRSVRYADPAVSGTDC